MSRPALTRDLAWSAAQDAANAQMRTAGRAKWSPDDYRLAVETFDRLWPEEGDYCALSAFVPSAPGRPEPSSYDAECAEFWRSIVRKLLAGDASALTEEEQRLVDRARTTVGRWI